MAAGETEDRLQGPGNEKSQEVTPVHQGDDQPRADGETGPGARKVKGRWWGHAFGPVRVFAGVVSGVTQAAEPVMER